MSKSGLYRLAITVLLGLCSCARDHQITEITVERKGCFGGCPVYSITLRRDGSATYIGKRFVERIGTFASKNRYPIDFAPLAKVIDYEGFFGLGEKYNVGSVDAEVVTTTVIRNNQSKAVTTFNSGKGPVELWIIDTLLDGVTANIPWQKQ
jgi:hypothetical protein